MKRTTLTTSLLAAGILAAPALSLSAWDRIVDFQEFDVGLYDSPDNNPINDTTVHVTRDEGWEGTRTGGEAIQRISADGNGNKYYMMETTGRGSTWAHVFSLVNWPTPITGIGTIYWEFAQMGPSNEYLIGAAEAPATQIDETHEDYTPWGWTGMRAWGQTRTGIQNNPNSIFTIMDSAWRPANLEDPTIRSGVWYQTWQHLNVANDEYELYVLGGQFEEITQLFVTIDDVDYYELFFRGAGTDAIEGLYINTINGSPGSPNLGDPWFINNIAVYNGVHTFERPTGTNMADPPGVLLPTKWGFRQINDVDREDADAYLLNGLNFLGVFWGNMAPWAYSVDLATWMYITTLLDSEGVLRAETSGRQGQAGSWNYVMNTGGGAIDDDGAGNVNSENYLGWVYTGDAPWYYMWDIGTWGYVAEGDLTTEGAWVWMANSSLE